MGAYISGFHVLGPAAVGMYPCMGLRRWRWMSDVT